MSMLEKLVLPEIRELIDAKDVGTLREILSDWIPPDLGALVEDLEPEEQAFVFRAMSKKRRPIRSLISISRPSDTWSSRCRSAK